MKKISKSSELLWVFGILFVALGVAFCSKANLGVSMLAAPSFVTQEIVSKIFGQEWFSVGMAEYMLQGIVIVILCIAVRKFNKKYYIGFFVSVIYGYTLNVSLMLLGLFPVESVIVRWIFLLLGDAITALGVACFFKTYLPLMAYELFVVELTKRYNLNMSKTKWVFDITLLTISIGMALSFGDFKTFNWLDIWKISYHNIGLGTIVTTIINTPLIMLMSKLVDKVFDPTPRFPKIVKVFKN